MELSFSVEFNDDTEEDAPSRDSSFLLSSSLSSSEQPHDPPAIHHRHCKHFRNRGYETWIAARQAWIDLGRENETNCPSSSSSSSRPPFPDKFKKELVKCLADRRQFELSNPIPLSEIIHAYNQAWNIESDDNEWKRKQSMHSKFDIEGHHECPIDSFKLANLLKNSNRESQESTVVFQWFETKLYHCLR